MIFIFQSVFFCCFLFLACRCFLSCSKMIFLQRGLARAPQQRSMERQTKLPVRQVDTLNQPPVRRRRETRGKITLPVSSSDSREPSSRSHPAPFVYGKRDLKMRRWGFKRRGLRARHQLFCLSRFPSQRAAQSASRGGR